VPQSRRRRLSTGGRRNSAGRGSMCLMMITADPTPAPCAWSHLTHHGSITCGRFVDVEHSQRLTAGLGRKCPTPVHRRMCLHRAPASARPASTRACRRRRGACRAWRPRPRWSCSARLLCTSCDTPFSPPNRVSPHASLAALALSLESSKPKAQSPKPKAQSPKPKAQTFSPQP
jgi:hypothetical protein